MKPKQKGFTLLELLIVIAIISTLATILFVALDPYRRLAESRNARRQEEIKSIVDAIYLYAVDNGGFPPGIDDSVKMLGTAGVGCEAICGETIASIELPDKKIAHNLIGIGAKFLNSFIAQAAQKSDIIDERDQNLPNFFSAEIIPKKVFPGDEMTVTAQIQDSFGLTSVVADMGGIETINLALKTGDIYNGLWEGKWLVRDTQEKNYLTTITATNNNNFTAQTHIYWSDPPATGWVSPTGFSDPGNQWSNETNAYDGDTSSYSSNNYGGAGWGQFIYLTLTDPILSDRLRLKIDYLDALIQEVDIDVIIDSVWTDAFQGGNEAEWNGKLVEITYAKDTVSQVRFRYNYIAGGYYYWLYELEVYQSAEIVSLPVCTPRDATAIQSTAAILHGQVADDGGEPCEYRFSYGKTIAYGNSTAWSGSQKSGDILSKLVTGLDPGTNYHFQTEVRNSAGTVYCTDKQFSTKIADSGWILPTGNYDPSNSWDYEDLAHDDMTNSYAMSYHNINDPLWSDYLYFTHAPIAADEIKFWARGGSEVNAISVDVLRDGGWVNVYEGAVTNLQWMNATFEQGLVTEARVKFSTPYTNHGFFWELYELVIKKSTATSETACLDLSTYMTPRYLPTMPHDPLVGTDTKTYYAIKRETDQSISVMNCYAELNKYFETNK